MSKIIDRYRPAGEGFVRIDTQNNMPTAAGLSSSSSGLSALVKACNAYFKLGLDRSQLAQEAKFASGSSSRSFYGPLGAWDKDSGEIYPVETDLKLAMMTHPVVKSRRGFHTEFHPVTTRNWFFLVF